MILEFQVGITVVNMEGILHIFWLLQPLFTKSNETTKNNFVHNTSINIFMGFFFFSILYSTLYNLIYVKYRIIDLAAWWIENRVNILSWILSSTWFSFFLHTEENSKWMRSIRYLSFLCCFLLYKNIFCHILLEIGMWEIWGLFCCFELSV